MTQTDDAPRAGFLSEVEDAVSTRAAALVIGVPARGSGTPHTGAGGTATAGRPATG
ncbi:hypothetical protein [Streptomyces lunaelactis]|uniref:hypothetical protein n=1 Tax=Streptomyces lunaelactis TaxID=1535768 RepID=UPI00131F1DF4|nr:hypothetical protein [Streptomyces lunaelactis]NUK89789.1 hypothetical protein [Streptomyces lunaelactis]NUL07734.1 hypothetical protein [Streptomyces lunaelactis]